MTTEQVLILAILAATIAMFMWGRWRHDMVAVASLLACVLLGLAPPDEAFAGFGHPAVITVACVLILSRGLQATGAVDALAYRLLPASAGPTLAIASLTGMAAFLSAFMNNVGALALLMPIGLKVASRLSLPPGHVLMPLAFGSILGGMTTLIGTPPNLIVAGFRAETGESGFGMFDYTPVGLVVAFVGVLFVALVGRFLVPVRERSGVEGFETARYLTEVRLRDGSKAVGQSVRQVEDILAKADAQVVGMVRNEFRVSAPNASRILQAGDILVIEAEPETLGTVLSTLGLKLEESVRPPVEDEDEESTEKAEDMETEHAGRAAVGAPQDVLPPGSDSPEESEEQEVPRKLSSGETVLIEFAVLPNADLIGRSATDLNLRLRYGINLLAFSREGRRTIRRLRTTTVMAGDVLLMQGDEEALSAFAAEFGCVPLAERPILVPNKKRAILATATMLGAVAGAAFGLLPAAISFAAGVLASMAFRIVPIRKIYSAVDWPVVVLLAALIPVAGAISTTGAADLIALFLLETVGQGHAIVALVLVLVVTMTMSDFMNNAATAAVMAPISISAALQLGVNTDTFLMAVAVGASCAFLTPIGHQNNTLILGPAGLKFGDYWRLGIPMELIVIGAGVPALLYFWPL